MSRGESSEHSWSYRAALLLPSFPYNSSPPVEGSARALQVAGLKKKKKRKIMPPFFSYKNMPLICAFPSSHTAFQSMRPAHKDGLRRVGWDIQAGIVNQGSVEELSCLALSSRPGELGSVSAQSFVGFRLPISRL